MTAKRWTPIGLILLALAPAVAGGEPIRIGGTGAASRTIEQLAGAYRSQTPGASIVVRPGLGSRGAKRGLLAGALDVGFSAEPPSPAEAAQGLGAVELARTALVFATAIGGATAITSQTVVDAYAGRLTRWPDGRRLRLILRPAGDSDNTVLRRISPGFREAVGAALLREGLLVAATDQDAADALASVPGALGTTTLALIVAEQRPLTPLALDGVHPSVATLASGRYPHTKTLHVLTRRPEASAPVAGFVRFLGTAEARAILGRTGFLPGAARP